IASVTKPPEWPRRVGGIRPEWSSCCSLCAACAADADPSPGPGTGRRYSGRSRGDMLLPGVVGQVVVARIERVVPRLHGALRVPEPVGHLRLGHGAAVAARTND